MSTVVKINGTKFADLLQGTPLRDIIKGKAGADTILGGAGNDKLSGGAGDDVITGGSGNDTIDGGKGIDTAVYQGRYQDYTLSFSDKNNLKGTITDSIVSRDGIDTLKNVEWLRFSDALYDVANDILYVLNNPAVIGNPTVHDVTEDIGTNGSGNLTAVGTISISDADAGQAAFQTTVTSANGNLGSLSLAANGAYTYSVANSAVQYLGTGLTKVDSFTVTSIDGTTKLVSFTIHGQNDAAVLSSATVGLTETDAVLGTSGALTVSDVDSPASFVGQSGTAGQYGSFSIDAAGTWSYVAGSAHNEFVAGATYTDGFLVASADGTTSSVTINIHGTNDAPVAHDDVVIGGAGAATVIVFDDYDAFANTLSDFHGYSFGGYVNLFGGTGTGGSLSLGVGIYNDGFGYGATIARADGADFSLRSVDAASYYQIGTPFSFIGYHDGLAVASLSPVFLAGYTGLSYPHIDFSALDSAWLMIDALRLTDLTNSGSFNYLLLDNLTVGDVAHTENFATDIGVLGNDTDVDGGAVLSVAAVDATSSLGATLSVNPDGTVHYDSNHAAAIDALARGETANDTFSYTVTDEYGATDTATVTVQLVGENDAASIAGMATGSVTEDGTLTAGGTLTVSDADAGQSRFQTPASLAGTYGSFAFDPTTGEWGYALNNGAANVQGLTAADVRHDTLTVTSADGSASRVIDVTINGADDIAANQPPETNVTSANGGTGTPIAVTLSGTDSDGTVAFFAITSPPTNGTLYSDALGLLPIQLNGTVAASGNAATVYFVANVAGPASFQYAAIDDNGAVDTTPATASITVNAPNQTPFGIPDGYSVGEASYLVATHLNVDAAHGVLANDFDPDHGPNALTAVLFSGPSHGTLTLNADGSFSYSPAAYYSSYASQNRIDLPSFNYDLAAQPDTFSYRAFDGAGYSAPITVSIAVTPPSHVNVNPYNYDMQGSHNATTEPMGKLYDDLALGGLTVSQIPPVSQNTPAIPLANGFRVTTGNGVTYELSGNDLTYASFPGLPTGGTITSLRILNPNPNENQSRQTLLAMIGGASGGPDPAWQFSAGGFTQALASYATTQNRSGLDAIFQSVRYEMIEEPPLAFQPTPQEVMTGSPFDDALRGAGGHVSLFGGLGNDVLAGNGDDAQLTGGTGSDRFEFGGSAGPETVRDFSGIVGGEHDVIDLRVFLFVDNQGHLLYRAHGLGDVLQVASSAGADTVLNFTFGQFDPAVITLKNVDIADLRADDFFYANYAPTAQGDSAMTNRATPVDIYVLVNDFDQDNVFFQANDVLSLVGVSSSSAIAPTQSIATLGGATVSVVGDHVVYDPTSSAAFQFLPNGQMTPDSFYYTISDGHGGSSTAAVNMNIFGI